MHCTGTSAAEPVSGGLSMRTGTIIASVVGGVCGMALLWAGICLFTRHADAAPDGAPMQPACQYLLHPRFLFARPTRLCHVVLYATGLLNKGRKPCHASLTSMHGLGVNLHHSTMHFDLQMVSCAGSLVPKHLPVWQARGPSAAGAARGAARAQGAALACAAPHGSTAQGRRPSCGASTPGAPDMTSCEWPMLCLQSCH